MGDLSSMYRFIKEKIESNDTIYSLILLGDVYSELIAYNYSFIIDSLKQYALFSKLDSIITTNKVKLEIVHNEITEIEKTACNNNDNFKIKDLSYCDIVNSFYTDLTFRDVKTDFKKKIDYRENGYFVFPVPYSRLICYDTCIKGFRDYEAIFNSLQIAIYFYSLAKKLIIMNFFMKKSRIVKTNFPIL